MSEASVPLLSVVVVVVSDTLEVRAQVRDLAGCLEALQGQVGAPETEIIVPCHENTDGVAALALRFPDVRMIAVHDARLTARKAGSREHHDILRARGLGMARGALVALLEDHARPDPHWAASIVAAHRAGDAAIGGAIENGVDRALNWAVYFCDFSRYQNPVPAGESSFASDANTAYKRVALESVRPLWEHSFNEVIVNGALRNAGKSVSLSPDMVVYQHRSDLRFGAALHERYVWGRSYAVTRGALLAAWRRPIYAALSPLLPAVMMLRTAKTAKERRRHWRTYVRVAPLIFLLTCGWSVGECIGYIVSSFGRR